MSRPAAPFEPEPGFEWQAVPDEQWTTDPKLVERRRCRFGASGTSLAHGTPAAAILFRERRDGRRLPYAYCAEHLYGRWLEAGRVMGWRLRPSG